MIVPTPYILCVGQLHNHLVVDHKAELVNHAKLDAKNQQSNTIQSIFQEPIIFQGVAVLIYGFYFEIHGFKTGTINSEIYMAIKSFYLEGDPDLKKHIA